MDRLCVKMEEVALGPAYILLHFGGHWIWIQELLDVLACKL